MIFCTQHNIDANLVPLGIATGTYKAIGYLFTHFLQELERSAPPGTTHLFSVDWDQGTADAYGPRS